MNRNMEEGRAGFTLIELLIVSAVILVLISFSMPQFRKSFAGLELKETASTIAKMAALAQQRAIIERGVYRLTFDFEKKTYQLFKTSGEGQDIVFISPRDRFGRLFYIPRGIEIEGRFKEIFFYPDGHCDNGNPGLPEQVSMQLTNKNGRVLTITTTGTLGNVVIEE